MRLIVILFLLTAESLAMDWTPGPTQCYDIRPDKWGKIWYFTCTPSPTPTITPTRDGMLELESALKTFIGQLKELNRLHREIQAALLPVATPTPEPTPSWLPAGVINDVTCYVRPDRKGFYIEIGERE